MQSDCPVPPAFLDRLSTQGVDTQAFAEVLELPGPISVRLNREKMPDHFDWISLPRVPWDVMGRFLAQRPAFSRDPFYHGGVYYPMEAGSMLLSHVLKNMNLPEDAVLLDLCAAPGGKSLILKDAFPEQVLVSNEIEYKRAQVLKENAVRWGTEKHVVLHSDGARISKTGVKFDLILVDAPCSGEGLFRKDPKSRMEWTSERATGCAIRQRQILDEVPDMLNPGGYLIYSTCTYNPAENTEQCDYLVENFGLKAMRIDIPENWGLDLQQGKYTEGYQSWPHRTEGEGFFISVLQKPVGEERRVPGNATFRQHTQEVPDWVSSGMELIAKSERGYLGYSAREFAVSVALKTAGLILRSGLFLGTDKGGKFAPSQDLAMHRQIRNWDRREELDDKQVLSYLSGHALNAAQAGGYILMCHRGVPLGWAKSAGNRLNNLYPGHLRVRV